ncbi:MAG: hypothetical protein EAZ85_14695 [Bacteroidetes bacterium]|nr:MAG: hypothetical protein EAZ85_14695 [Bacteroidota bacterium]TAG85717.1 MAG: hypothetical protein EAZ20_14400 [Bacteroidota bacterium]
MKQLLVERRFVNEKRDFSLRSKRQKHYIYSTISKNHHFRKKIFAKNSKKIGILKKIFIFALSYKFSLPKIYTYYAVSLGKNN